MLDCYYLLSCIAIDLQILECWVPTAFTRHLMNPVLYGVAYGFVIWSHATVLILWLSQNIIVIISSFVQPFLTFLLLFFYLSLLLLFVPDKTFEFIYWVLCILIALEKGQAWQCSCLWIGNNGCTCTEACAFSAFTNTIGCLVLHVACKKTLLQESPTASCAIRPRL